MCGIFAVYHSSLPSDRLRARALQLSRRLRHRGPDWSGIHLQSYVAKVAGHKESICNVLAHERLAIVDPENGAQPLFSHDLKRVLSVNGEIYNHRQLRKRLADVYEFQTGSDCETILALYEYFKKNAVDRSIGFEPIEQKYNDFKCSDVKVNRIEASDWDPIDGDRAMVRVENFEPNDDTLGARILNRLDGVFAFVLIDEATDHCFAARDPMGVCPLYVGWASDGSTWFASEFKALHEDCVRFREFPPGHYYCSKRSAFVRYYKPKWLTCQELPVRPYDPVRLRTVLEQSVVKRLMCDVPYGVLLSGGLDSSLIASLVCRHAAKRIEEDETSSAWYPRVHTFSVGLRGSPDLAAARKVAAHLNTLHHECVFTVQQALDAIRDVIYHVETYDVTTIRASTPMYLLSRLVKACGIKMLLSGEGADEAFAGYLYFHHAPNAVELHAECRRKLVRLSRFDCLRANQAPAAFGVEVRVPFLDRAVLCEAMSIDPNEKLINSVDRSTSSSGQSIGPTSPQSIEKYILRQAFADMQPPLLPPEVLWRPKEQFSDGVGYAWIDGLKQYAETLITDAQMSNAKYLYPHNTPTNKEAFLYRQSYEELFPSSSAAYLIPGGPSIACSTETAVRWRQEWIGVADPSGRAIVDVHPNGF